MVNRPFIVLLALIAVVVVACSPDAQPPPQPGMSVVDATNDGAGSGLVPMQDGKAGDPGPLAADLGSGPLDGKSDVKAWEQACAPGDGCFLEACETGADCASGWCSEHQGESACTVTCVDECPSGFQCRQVTGTARDISYICVSLQATVCRPCAANADCSTPGAEGVCVRYGPNGSFCGAACDTEADCLSGYGCQDTTTVDGVPTRQCVNKLGMCTCSASAVDRGAWTSCDVTNTHGTCAGKRSCSAVGLSQCDAPVPTAETCNGVDDNCNGLTDEPALEGGEFKGLCDDGNPCTEETCGGLEGCKQTALDGVPCPGMGLCETGMLCKKGVCEGTPINCADSKVCTVDTCDPTTGQCSHVPKDSGCPATNNPCVGSVFCDPFADIASDPDQDGCVVVYKPAGTGCNDNDACTTGETCVSQESKLVCLGQPIGLDDGNVCTNDWCDPVTGPKHDAIEDCQAPCTPGELMTATCGKCGVHSKTCPQSGKWFEAPWGQCSAEGPCTPSTTDSIACGNCGAKVRACTAQCQWGEWGECTGAGECTQGDTTYEACEGVCMSKKRTCNANCSWGTWTGCQFEGQCSAKASETQACGKCGTQARTCSATCTWGSWGACQGEKLCAPNEVAQQACGKCGTQTRTCSSQCGWGSWSQCNDPCACQCTAGTCCADGCHWDKLGASCGACKSCDATGGCTQNKPKGTPCTSGVCDSGSCVQCLSGTSEQCNPMCGTFTSSTDGVRDCVANKWSQCLPATCAPLSTTVYTAVPVDEKWHCTYSEPIKNYLCLQANTMWFCGVALIELSFKKATDAAGNNSPFTFDNDLSVVVRNTSTGFTWSQDYVDCNGQTTCYVNVSMDDLHGTLGLSGTDCFQVDVYSPQGSTFFAGSAGEACLESCL